MLIVDNCDSIASLHESFMLNVLTVLYIELVIAVSYQFIILDLSKNSARVSYSPVKIQIDLEEIVKFNFFSLLFSL